MQIVVRRISHRLIVLTVYGLVPFIVSFHDLRLLLERGDFVGGEAGVFRDGFHGHAVGFHLTGGLAQFFNCRVALLPLLRKFLSRVIELSYNCRLTSHRVPVSFVCRLLLVAVCRFLDYLQSLGDHGIVQELLRDRTRLLVYLGEIAGKNIMPGILCNDLRHGKLCQLTRDHTLTAEILSHRLPQGAKPLADVRALALSHVLTRAVGVGQERLKVDWRRVDVKEGDVMLLCSDGVHGSVLPSELAAAVAAGGGAEEILGRICSLVVAAGAHDNYSAVVVKIGGDK